MKRRKHLGYLYLHAPDPEQPGQYVTHRIAVEQNCSPDDVETDVEGEGDDEPS